MKNIKEAFGENLRRIRKSKKITIEALAEKSHISSRLLSNIEAGDTFVSAETLCKICVALNVEPQVLFNFDWDDKVMYYDNGKYIKPHFKAVLKNNIYEVKSLPPLKNEKIIKKMQIGELTNFLMEFSKDKRMTIYIDFFTDKNRDKIVKYTPDGTFSFLTQNSEIKSKKPGLKINKYDIAMNKVREIAINEKRLEYIITASEALSNKKSRDKLRIMLDAIDLLIQG